MQRYSKVLLNKFQGHMKVTRLFIAREIAMLWFEVQGHGITVLTDKVKKVAWQDINRIIAEECLNNNALPSQQFRTPVAEKRSSIISIVAMYLKECVAGKCYHFLQVTLSRTLQ